MKARVRALNERLRDPTFIWPGLLLLDAPVGLTAQAFALEDYAPNELGYQLVEALRANGARRFAWIMPVLHERGDEFVECLLVVIGERGRVEAAVADVVRDPQRPPRLGPFCGGPFDGAARRVSGRILAPLLREFEPAPPHMWWR